MAYRFFTIDPRLKPFVKAICALETDAPAVLPPPIRVLPDTCVELFVNFCEPQRVVSANGRAASSGRSFITARLNHFMDVWTAGPVRFVSVCFAEGQAYRFFPVPMHNLANQLIDLGELWEDWNHPMQERVETAPTADQRVHLIQQHLIAQLQHLNSRDPGVDFCLRQIRQAQGLLSVETLADRTGLSSRQLIRRFNQRIGLSPKEFARMTVFLNALKHVKKHPRLSLTEIAHESGYYDQSHFIHACRDYTGLTPSQLLASNHVLC
ncbi:helix-turn-helix domain-containing protein [Larkinella ripae]